MNNKKDSISLRVFAMIFSLILALQPLSKINPHSYDVKGVYIHSLYGCLDQIPAHISYFCDYNH